MPPVGQATAPIYTSVAIRRSYCYPHAPNVSRANDSGWRQEGYGGGYIGRQFSKRRDVVRPMEPESRLHQTIQCGGRNLGLSETSAGIFGFSYLELLLTLFDLILFDFISQPTVHLSENKPPASCIRSHLSLALEGLREQAILAMSRPQCILNSTN